MPAARRKGTKRPVSNKADQQKQALLNQQQASLNAEATKARAAAATPSPLDQAQSDEALGYFNFLKDPNHDFTKLPGLAYAGMQTAGADEAEADRTALGAARFGSAAADPNLQAVLKATMTARRQQARGESLANAVNAYDAKMRGVSSEIAARDQARRMGNAGLTTQAGMTALQDYTQFQPRPSWGLTLASAGIGAAGSMFQGKL
jgi:hypothetical protein